MPDLSAPASRGGGGGSGAACEEDPDGAQVQAAVTRRVAYASTSFFGLASFSRCVMVMYSASTIGGLPGGYNMATPLLAP
jgi:hypothetical protein